MGATLALFAVVAAVPLIMGSCRVEGIAIGSQPSEPTVPPTAAEHPPVPAAIQPTLAPTTVPSAAPTVTQEQAQDVVRAWFEALSAGDYQKAEELTTGSATGKTRRLVDTVQGEARQRGVQATMAIRRLDLSPGTTPSDGQSVRAAFDIDVNALAGPVSVRVQQLHGSADFLVQQTAVGPKISDIKDVSGLPA